MKHTTIHALHPNVGHSGARCGSRCQEHLTSPSHEFVNCPWCLELISLAVESRLLGAHWGGQGNPDGTWVLCGILVDGDHICAVLDGVGCAGCLELLQ